MNVRSPLGGEHGVAVVHVLGKLGLPVAPRRCAAHQGQQVRGFRHPSLGLRPCIGGLRYCNRIRPPEITGEQRDLRGVRLLLSERVGAVAQAQFRYDLDQPRIGRLRRWRRGVCREWGCLCEDWIVAGVHGFGPSVGRFPCRN